MTFEPFNSKSIDTLISRGCGHVHMVGICGIGMAGVACLLKNRGFSVSGCDAALNRQAEWLKRGGISVDSPQSAGHIDNSVDWVVRTPAVSADCAEIHEAEQRGIPVLRRGEVLPALLAGLESVAVAGTHGKTTTATLVTQLLKADGRDPSWCIGGESGPLSAVAGVGEDAAIVVEADESDGTLALYHPEIAVVTNIEFDHMEHFDSEEDFNACFAAFVGQARRRVLYCAEDERAVSLCSAIPHAVGYGFGEGAELHGVLTETACGSELHVRRGDVDLGVVTVPIPGRHNAANALAAIGVCLELGLTFEAITAAMSSVALPRRRFEVVAQSGGVTVISDYAHHPSEIAALVQTAKQKHTGRLLAVFQPHRYSRTLALGADFPAAFKGVDRLILTPVYPASEKPLAGGRVCDLYARFRQAGTDAYAEGGALESRTDILSVSAPASGDGESDKMSDLQAEEVQRHACEQLPTPLIPLLATSLDQAWAYLRRELREGDMLLVIGAGDVEKIAAWSKAEIGGIPARGAGTCDACADRRGRLSYGEAGKGQRQASVPEPPPSSLKPHSLHSLVSNVQHRTKKEFPTSMFDVECSMFDVHSQVSPLNNPSPLGGPSARRPQLSKASIVRQNEPIGRKTTYGVGGTADIWVEVGSVEDLVEVLRWRHAQDVPFRVLGAGSNVLVSDLGVRGVVVRLTGDVFRSIRHESGDVTVGGAVPLARLLDWAEKESLTGLEFLEGVPGGVGGIVRMNGGAYGHEVSERLSWIRGLKQDGSECTLHASALEWGYRGCEALDSMVIVEVGLRLEPGRQDEISAARQRIAEKRAWMRGLRCSGSVFRNPPGQYAGRIVESLDLKGYRIGGAHVYGRHGNFVVADKDATASDVLALIQKVQAAVKEETGVDLVREVLLLE